MKLQTELSTIYLHREPVDFRKAVNGLMIIVEQEMDLSPFDDALFVFCNKSFLDVYLECVSPPPDYI